MTDKNRQSKINNRERAVGGKNGLETGFSTASLKRKNGVVAPVTYPCQNQAIREREVIL
jgi:hypothetical protein